MGRLQERVEALKSQIKVKKVDLAEAKESSIESILTELSDIYVTVFEDLYKGNVFLGAMQVLDKFQFTWDTERANFGTKFP